MSRTLYFDPFSGMAGDMIVGALLSLGAPWGAVEGAVANMAIPNLKVSQSLCKKGGVAAIKFTVEWSTASPPTHRHLPDILELVAKVGLTPRAELWASRAFEALARAEAKIHAMPAETVHLHEVGAEDSIADVVAACAALDALGVEGCAVGPIATGVGWTVGAHGRLPVPAPATVELLCGFVVEPGPVSEELTTPTAAALICGFEAEPVAKMPRGRLLGVGYGAGTKDLNHPNVLRIMVLETEDQEGAG